MAGTKNKSGGSRSGAGRPRTIDGKRIDIYLPLKVIEYLGSNRSQKLAKLVEDEMSKKIEITLGQDMDGFLGYDPAIIATIDIEASKTAYEQAINKLAEKELHLSVSIAWNGRNETSEYDGDPDELQSDLEELVDRVYNGQEFWVNK